MKGFQHKNQGLIYGLAMKNFWKTLKKPIFGLAPMDGVTDEPMRQIQCSIAKPDVMFTEFVQVEGFVRKSKIFKDKLAFSDVERPIVAQVVGCTPADFYETISAIVDMNFDGIDLNMGCPNKDVVKRGAGGALIGNYKLAEEIITISLKAVGGKVPLSIKTRIGKENPITEEWFSFLSQFPLSEITIHGRILNQGLSGPVNWLEIKKVAEILKEKNIVCIGNGGIKTRLEAEEKCKELDLDGILIGQAALGNPWIFKKNYHPGKQEILETILKHGQLAWNFYGEKKYINVLKHYGWYPREFDGCKQLRIDLLKTRNVKEVNKVISEFSD